MIIPANSPIGPNSLVPPSQSWQDAQDYRTGQVLAAGLTAKAASQCTAPAQSFASLGPGIQAEVAGELQRAQEGLIDRTSILTPLISDVSGQGAIITDDDIASAPQVTAPGTTYNGSAYTPSQVAAAGPSPVDWTTQTLQPASANAPVANPQPGQRFHRLRAFERARRFPGAPWGVPSEARDGQCNSNASLAQIAQANPWGTILIALGSAVILYNIWES